MSRHRAGVVASYRQRHVPLTTTADRRPVPDLGVRHTRALRPDAGGKQHCAERPAHVLWWLSWSPPARARSETQLLRQSSDAGGIADCNFRRSIEAYCPADDRISEQVQFLDHRVGRSRRSLFPTIYRSSHLIRSSD